MLPLRDWLGHGGSEDAWGGVAKLASRWHGGGVGNRRLQSKTV